MSSRVFLPLVFFFCFSSASAQKWQWALPTAQNISYIDMTHNVQGDVITLEKDNDRSYYLRLYGADQNLRYSKEFYYPDAYSNCAYEVEPDREGNVYVLSRQTLPDIAPENYRDEYEPEDEEASSAASDYIVLEKFSPELELLQSVRLIRMESSYGVDVSELKVDAKGNIWCCGVTTDERYYFMDQTITPGTGGGAFLVHVPAARYADAWIKNFGSGGTCCTYTVDSYNLAVNADGICVMSGTFTGDLTLNDRVTFQYDTAQQFEGEMFLAAFNENGEMKWTKRMNAPSYDKDIVALANGSFVCAGFYVGATKIGTYRLAARDTGHFLMELAPSNGKIGKVYLNDSCAMENLIAGAGGSLYCTFQKGNSDIVHEVYQFNHQLRPKRLTRFTGNNPVITVVNGQFYCAGEYGWNCAFGDNKPNWLSIGGDSSSWGSFLAKCSLNEKS